jgi:hypothetical protein
VTSQAVLDERGLVIELDIPARLAGVVVARQIVVPRDEIVREWTSDALTVGRTLRWKIAGTALSRQRAMGWFSRPGHRGSWAWVWLTPGRAVRVFETSRRRPGLVAVPEDWFGGGSAR